MPAEPTNSPQHLTRFQGTVFEGPLPPPEILIRYNDAVPDAAERILRMAERNQEHRQRLEAVVIPAKVRSESRGQLIGLTLALAVIGCGTYVIAIGASGYGFAMILSDLAALVSVFVYVDYRKRKELDRKRDDESDH